MPANPGEDAAARVIGADLGTATQVRAGERKLGEAAFRPPAARAWIDQIAAAVAAGVRFVVVGIPEDIGVVANHGTPGARGAWECALTGIANVQSNRFLEGSDVWIAGCVDVGDLQQAADVACAREADATLSLRRLVPEVDDRVTAVLQPLFAAGLHPIVIGGGNNNSLPILRALARHVRELSPQASVGVVNCDPHADCRSMEGRHSGNPFSYALHEGSLDRYFALLLHRSYNAESMLRALEGREGGPPRFECNWFEDLLERRMDLDSALDSAIRFVSGSDTVGLELDCDAIANFPTSAYTPSGLRFDDVRSLMLRAARALAPRYLHVCEAAPSRTTDGELRVRKGMAYLVSDHLRAMGAAGVTGG